MRFILLLILLAFLGCSSERTTERTYGLGEGGAGGEQAHPNVLLILVDDWGADASSLYPQFVDSSGAAEMPTVEGLADAGITFDNAWATPLCMPTRATVVSGRYGHQLPVTNNTGPALSADTLTVFDRLTAETDYGSALIGKYHLGSSTAHVASIGVPYFKGILGSHITNYYSWTVASSTAPNYNTTVFATTALTDFAIDFIDAHESADPNKPWFLYQAYNSAHEPLRVPPSNLHTVDLGGAMPGTLLETLPSYKANLQALDTEIGRLLAAVDMTETTVIIIGDNGTDNQYDGPLRSVKGTIHEGGIRVPLVVSGAGVTRTGREAALVQATDIYATILSLAGLPVTQVNDSYSFAGLLSDPLATSGRTHAFSEIANSNGTGHKFAIRDDRYKLSYNNETGNYSLFDLQVDPFEVTNRYKQSAYATQKASLHAALAPIIAAAPPEFFP